MKPAAAGAQSLGSALETQLPSDYSGTVAVTHFCLCQESSKTMRVSAPSKGNLQAAIKVHPASDYLGVCRALMPLARGSQP